MKLRRAAVGGAGPAGERVREVSERAAVEGSGAVGEVCIRGKRRRNLEGVEEEEEEEEEEEWVHWGRGGKTMAFGCGVGEAGSGLES